MGLKQALVDDESTVNVLSNRVNLSRYSSFSAVNAPVISFRATLSKSLLAPKELLINRMTAFS